MAGEYIHESSSVHVAFLIEERLWCDPFPLYGFVRRSNTTSNPFFWASHLRLTLHGDDDGVAGLRGSEGTNLHDVLTGAHGFWNLRRDLAGAGGD